MVVVVVIYSGGCDGSGCCGRLVAAVSVSFVILFFILFKIHIHTADHHFSMTGLCIKSSHSSP